MTAQSLTREKVLHTALEILRQEGTDALTARNLAASLKCSLTTLYSLVGKREQLIESLLEHYFLNWPITISPALSWQEQVFEWAHAVRSAMISHPNLSCLLRSEHRAVHVHFAAVLFGIFSRAGFTDQDSLNCSRVLAIQVVDLSRIETMELPLSEQRQQRDGTSQTEEEIALGELGVQMEDMREVFERSVRYTISGIDKEHSGSSAQATVSADSTA